MLRLNKTQIQKKIDFIESYISSANPADGSPFDPNANVEHKNIATMEAEINKDINIQVNREIMRRTITEMYDEDLANEYITSIENKECYIHDETRLCPYCVSVSLYPLLLNGTKGMAGESEPPRHLNSFCGSFINLAFALSSQFAGACLHKNQRLLLNKDGKNIAPKISEFVEEYNLNKSFNNWQGDWEYADVSDVKVWENGRYVNVKKVYRRKYNKSIYTIKTASGKKIKCSEDHIFKVLFRDRYIEVKASDLNLYDTVINTMPNYNVNQSSDDFMHGQLIGIIAGDGCITGENSVTVAINTKERFIAEFLDIAFEKFYGKKGYLDKGNRCFDYRLHSRTIVKEIRTYFTGDGCYAHNKQIDVSLYSLDFLVGFLDGVMVTDGGWPKTHRLVVTSKGLVENIKDILEMLGVHRDIKYTPPHDNKKDLYEITFSNQLNKYIPLTIIRRSGNRSFLSTNDKEIPYYGAHTHKNSNGRIQKGYSAYSSSHRKSDVTLDSIVDISIENNDCGYVYEIETDSHWYSAGGILTHNCATTEYLLYFDYFARKDYGQGYLDKYSDKMANYMQQVVYSINQPAAARGFQSVFWNISIFDRFFAESLFQDFRFPDGSLPDFASLYKLQEFFMTWFNKERERTVLTFPVVTAAMVSDGDKPKDTEFADMCAEQLEAGNSFFVYMSESVDSLASCCRLRNELVDNTFSYTLGAGGVATGSINVITINMNRLVYNAMQKGEDLQEAVTSQVRKIHKYHLAYKSIIQKFVDAGIMPAYNSGYITLSKQFMTIGINGLVEAAETYGLTPGNNDAYKAFLSSLLKPIYDENRKAREEHGHMFNTECVPAENLGVKNAKWDKKYGMDVKRDCYNSYFYPVEDESINMVDKFILHGKEVVQYLDGGSALHLNMEEYPSKQQYLHIFNIAAKAGCNYFTTNIKVTVCNSCGYINKKTKQTCVKCGSNDIDHATRIIGYLKRVGSYSKERKEEHSRRHYHKGE